MVLCAKSTIQKEEGTYEKQKKIFSRNVSGDNGFEYGIVSGCVC